MVLFAFMIHNSPFRILRLADAALNAAVKAKKGKTPEATAAFLRLREELPIQFDFHSPRGDTLPGHRQTMLLSPSAALEFAFKKDEYSMSMLSKVNTALKAPVSLCLAWSDHTSPHDTEPGSQSAH